MATTIRYVESLWHILHTERRRFGSIALQQKIRELCKAFPCLVYIYDADEEKPPHHFSWTFKNKYLDDRPVFLEGKPFGDYYISISLEKMLDDDFQHSLVTFLTNNGYQTDAGVRMRSSR